MNEKFTVGDVFGMLAIILAIAFAVYVIRDTIKHPERLITEAQKKCEAAGGIYIGGWSPQCAFPPEK